MRWCLMVLFCCLEMWPAWQMVARYLIKMEIWIQNHTFNQLCILFTPLVIPFVSNERPWENHSRVTRQSKNEMWYVSSILVIHSKTTQPHRWLWNGARRCNMVNRQNKHRVSLCSHKELAKKTWVSVQFKCSAIDLFAMGYHLKHDNRGHEIWYAHLGLNCTFQIQTWASASQPSLRSTQFNPLSLEH